MHQRIQLLQLLGILKNNFTYQFSIERTIRQIRHLSKKLLHIGYQAGVFDQQRLCPLIGVINWDAQLLKNPANGALATTDTTRNAHFEWSRFLR